MEESSHLSSLHLMLSGSKGGFLQAVLTIIIIKKIKLVKRGAVGHLCNDLKHSSPY